MGADPAMPRGGVPRRALGLLLGLAAHGQAWGQGRADAPITLLAGAAPGTATDLWVRGFAPFLERHWSRAPVGVANLPEGRGLAMLRAVADAPAEAPVIGAIATPSLLARLVEAGEVGLLTRIGFLAAVVEEPVLLVGHPDSVGDFAAGRGGDFAAGRGGDLAAGGALGPRAILGMPAPGTAAQLAGAGLAPLLALSGLSFANAAAARQAVVAGHIPYALLAAPDAILALREGRLAALGVAQPTRSPLLPEVPTLAEQGLPVAVLAQRGFVVSAGMPAAQRQRLAAAMRAAVADPEFADQAQASGRVPGYAGPEPWDASMRRETRLLEQRWLVDAWTGRRG